MGRFLEQLVSQSSRIIGFSDGSCFRIQRVRSADLVEHGVAELVGAADVIAAVKDIQDAQRAAAAATDADRAKLEEMEAHNAKQALKKLQERVQRNPELLKAFNDRSDAFCCAGIIEAGEWEPDDEAPLHGVEIAAGAPEYMDPIRFTLMEGGARHEAKPPLVWVACLPEAVRGALSGHIQALTSSRAEVRPFRSRARPVAESA
jgi:hypothetical protein